MAAGARPAKGRSAGGLPRRLPCAGERMGHPEPDGAHHRLHAAARGGRRRGAHCRGRARPSADAHESALALRLRPRRAVGAARRGRHLGHRRPRRGAGCARRCPPAVEDLCTYADFEVAEGQRIPFVDHPPRRPTFRDPTPSTRYGRCRDTDELVEPVDGRLPLRRTLARRGPPLGHAAQGPDIRAHRWDRRRGNDLAARAARRPRNWDYRYCWLRDATFTLQAAAGAGFVTEAPRLAGVAAARRGRRPGPAADHVRRGRQAPPDRDDAAVAGRLCRVAAGAGGQRGGRPVPARRLGRGARRLCTWPARSAWTPTTPPGTCSGRCSTSSKATGSEPDNGLWEVRGPQRQFVHSKVMAWAALDRAVRTVENHGLPGPVDTWRELRRPVHDEVCAQGYDPERNTFTQSYGSRAAGRGAAAAAAGGVPAVATIPRVRRHRRGGRSRSCAATGFVLRYRTEHSDDGLPGGEGAFLACTFWLADALSGIGRDGAATELFERLLSLRNDVGLLSEEYDTEQRPAGGQHPAGVQPRRADQHRPPAQRAFHPDVIAPARAAAGLVSAAECGLVVADRHSGVHQLHVRRR